TSSREPSVGRAGKAVQDRILSAVSDLVNHSAAERASRVRSSTVKGRTVKAAREIQQATGRLLSIPSALAKRVQDFFRARSVETEDHAATNRPQGASRITAKLSNAVN